MLVEQLSTCIEKAEKPTHECGIGMIYTYAPTQKKEQLLAIGHALQHRGQNGAGIASSNMEAPKTGKGLLDKAISEKDNPSLDIPSYWAMIHLRYGTSGGYSDENLQPIHMTASNGDSFVVEVNGNNPLMERLRGYYDLPTEWSDTRIAAFVLSQMAVDDWDQAVLAFAEMEEVAEGANNMFIGTGDSVYIIRDTYRVHPFVYGELNDGEGEVYGSETVLFQKLGIQPKGEVFPGSVTKLTPQGKMILKEGHNGRGNACIFEPAYFSSPNSHIEAGNEKPEQWMSNMWFRMKCGEYVARESPVPHADFVVGMPDSGVPFAHGFANRAQLPYFPSMIRSHYNGEGDVRTFMQDSQMSTIPLLVKGKHMPVADPRVWKDKVVVIGDDSLVRGSNTQQISEMIWRLGAKEIHWRYGYPQVRFPCPLGVSFRSPNELVAAIAEGDNEKIAKLIGVTSVGFISNEAIIQATRESKDALHAEGTDRVFLENGWCGGCVTGQYPIQLDDMKEGTIFRSKKS